MKRIRALLSVTFSVAFFSLSICGCSIENGKYDGREYLVSALGIDEADGKIKLCAEITVAGSESNEAACVTEITEKSGDSIEEALYQIRRSSAETLIFGHCELIIIGENVSQNTFSQLCDYCYSHSDITSSVSFVTAKSPVLLLSEQKNGSASVGYGIVSMLSRQSEYSGIKYKNRFYELYSLREKPLNVFALPRLEADGGELYFSGLTVFSNYSPKVVLDDKQSFIYALMTDSQGKGRAVLNGKETEIIRAHCVWRISEKTEAAELLVNLRLEQRTSEAKSEISGGIFRLLETAEELGTDIFGISNSLHGKKQPSNMPSYLSGLKNTAVTVNIK